MKNYGKTLIQPLWYGTKSLKDADDIQSLLVKNTQDGGVGNYILILNHPPTFAIGARKKWDNLISDKELLEKQNFSFYQSNRGGDITYHWPGQLNVYPVVKLSEIGVKVPEYMSGLEEVIIRTLKHFGIEGKREKGYTGVWHGNDKIASMGTRIDRGTASYGFAINLSGDISPVSHIIPCGYENKGFTTIEKVAGVKIDLADVIPVVLGHFSEVFNMEPLALLNLDYSSQGSVYEIDEFQYSNRNSFAGEL